MKKDTTNYKEAAKVALELGEASIDEVHTLLPHFTRRQVAVALGNACTHGLIACTKRPRSLGKGKGSSPGLYGPVSMACLPATRRITRINSVFALGAMA